MSHGRWWGSLLPLNHLRTAASPCSRWFPLKFGNFCQDMEWQRMVVWASILQSTADIRHLYRFAKEIHQKKAKSMVFQYSKYLVDFNKISPIPSWKKPWDTNLMNGTSIPGFLWGEMADDRSVAESERDGQHWGRHLPHGVTCPAHKVGDFRFLSIRDGRDLIKL